MANARIRLGLAETVRLVRTVYGSARLGKQRLMLFVAWIDRLRPEVAIIPSVASQAVTPRSVEGSKHATKGTRSRCTGVRVIVASIDRPQATISRFGLRKTKRISDPATRVALKEPHD